MFPNNYINFFHKLINFMIGITSFGLRHSEPFKVLEIVFSDEYTEPVFEDKIDGDVLTRTVVYKTKRFADNFANLKVSDFSLSNLMAIGASSLLKPVQFAPDSLAASDALTSGAEAMLNEMSNTKSNE